MQLAPEPNLIDLTSNLARSGIESIDFKTELSGNFLSFRNDVLYCTRGAVLKSEPNIFRIFRILCLRNVNVTNG